MTDELRDAAEVERWLALGLAVRRIAPDAGAGGRPEPSDDELVGDALRACANELPALPPPGVVADIATLLTGARPVTRATDAGGEGLRAALRAYDDDVLVRLRGATRFDDVLAAYAHAAPTDRPAAAALVVGAVCERARFAGLAVSPAALRRALARLHTPGGSAPGFPREGDAFGRALPDDDPMAHRLADAYHRLARGARQCRALIDDREVFAVDHLGVLRDLGGRMTAAHIGAAAFSTLAFGVCLCFTFPIATVAVNLLPTPTSLV
ncbi:MAG TPA: hypothetical protein VLM79_25110, partial [Kofleriaceae bacterium]|nr:hypothetical protein [Kofleriaceae bacterium]